MMMMKRRMFFSPVVHSRPSLVCWAACASWFWTAPPSRPVPRPSGWCVRYFQSSRLPKGVEHVRGRDEDGVTGSLERKYHCLRSWQERDSGETPRKFTGEFSHFNNRTTLQTVYTRQTTKTTHVSSNTWDSDYNKQQHTNNNTTAITHTQLMETQ